MRRIVVEEFFVGLSLAILSVLGVASVAMVSSDLVPRWALIAALIPALVSFVIGVMVRARYRGDDGPEPGWLRFWHGNVCEEIIRGMALIAIGLFWMLAVLAVSSIDPKWGFPIVMAVVWVYIPVAVVYRAKTGQDRLLPTGRRAVVVGLALAWTSVVVLVIVGAAQGAVSWVEALGGLVVATVMWLAGNWYARRSIPDS